jgi:hypothetical protein
MDITSGDVQDTEQAKTEEITEFSSSKGVPPFCLFPPSLTYTHTLMHAFMYMLLPVE